jgi:hypothetical protein
VCEGDDGDVARAVQLVEELMQEAAAAAAAEAGGSAGESAGGTEDGSERSTARSEGMQIDQGLTPLNVVGRDGDWEGSVEGTPLWLVCLAARNGVTGTVGRGLHSFPFQLNWSSSVHLITQFDS